MSLLLVLLFVNAILQNVLGNVVVPQSRLGPPEKEDINNGKIQPTYINIPKNKSEDSAPIKVKEQPVESGKQPENVEVQQVAQPKVENKIDSKVKNESTSIRVPVPIDKNSNKSVQTYELGSDAFERAVLVMGVIAFVFIIFVGIKTFRRKNKMPMVVKYGVRTKRNDVEMEPLPLNEDDDDETIFDLSSNRR